VYTIYTITGTIFPKANNITLYYSLAIIFSVLLITCIYLLCGPFTNNSFQKIFILFLICFGGGLGFLFNSPQVSADTSIPGVTSLSNFQKPHEAISTILYTSSLVFFLLATKTKKNTYWIFSILSFIFFVPIHPYKVLSFYLITIIYLLATNLISNTKHQTTQLWIFFSITLLASTIYILHFLSSGFSSLTSYTASLIPITSIIFGYGISMVVFIFQLFHINKNNFNTIFLNIWIIVSLLLSILPFGFNRLYLNGLLFPMAILLTQSLSKISNYLKTSKVQLIFLVTLLCLPTSIHIFNKRLTEINNNNTWYYLPTSIQSGLNFINTSDKDGVLALTPINSFIPAQTGKHVYFGLKDLTPNYVDKINQAQAFYTNNYSQDEAKKFLQDNNINIIFVSDPNAKPDYSFLKTVYQNDNIQILELN